MWILGKYSFSAPTSESWDDFKRVEIPASNRTWYRDVEVASTSSLPLSCDSWGYSRTRVSTKWAGHSGKHNFQTISLRDPNQTAELWLFLSLDMFEGLSRTRRGEAGWPDRHQAISKAEKVPECKLFRLSQGGSEGGFEVVDPAETRCWTNQGGSLDLCDEVVFQTGTGSGWWWNNENRGHQRSVIIWQDQMGAFLLTTKMGKEVKEEESPSPNVKNGLCNVWLTIIERFFFVMYSNLPSIALTHPNLETYVNENQPQTERT